ncbi:MAG: hypothetical protein K6G79_08460 [Bacteroidales bacterium]|nr:hypothetical protein [Bacteroidales bacterium]
MRRIVVVTLSSLVFVLTGCSDLTKSQLTQEKEIAVTLNLKGDFDVEVTQNPLTKATSTDAYGINVYYDKESDGVTNDVYAYGLFDNVAAMTITLLSGHKYKFTCALIKDAKNVLYYGQAFGNSYSGYAYPFQTTSSGSTQLGNRFIINENNIYLSGLGSGGVHLKSNSSPTSSNATTHACVNRFYGETDQYEPVQNGTVDIYLKRVIFGAKFVVTGVQNGSVNVSCSPLINSTFTSDYTGPERIFSFADPYNCWKNETPETWTVSIDYTSDRGGTLWNLSKSQSVTFKRNVLTTVYINLTLDLSDASFILSTEEPFGDDNDITIGINTDGLIDIIVNPND